MPRPSARLSPGLALGLELKKKARERSKGLDAVRACAADFAALGRYDTPEAFEALVRWTEARLAYAGKRRTVFGVSGGVDSSLTACVLKAAAPRGVTAFILPCGSSPTDEVDARALCRALRIPVERIDLRPAYDALSALLSPMPGHPTADGNLKTRLRTATLFHEAAARDALFVGTGDLDEGFVGYYTKGSGSDLAPLGSLHKREVRALLKHALGRIDAKLAARLSRKPADAGLVPGRLAEDDLGVTYDAHRALAGGHLRDVRRLRRRVGAAGGGRVRPRGRGVGRLAEGLPARGGPRLLRAAQVRGRTHAVAPRHHAIVGGGLRERIAVVGWPPPAQLAKGVSWASFLRPDWVSS